LGAFGENDALFRADDAGRVLGEQPRIGSRRALSDVALVVAADSKMFPESSRMVSPSRIPNAILPLWLYLTYFVIAV
jgi:hypothetical protein